ncbi:endozepine-like protein [Cordyceps javanica]|uniref:Endozepine-like protein n=1 Tax=Cordyceps javanica TaxID=43265 RepID=A0A545V7B9_9HYPO|nr:endozepine-like protein [Cordyceps javanica]TQW09215.1 endozepine-like protein [Cordyceps javanica]
MPPPPGTPTSPRAMRRASQSFPIGIAPKAVSPAKQDESNHPGRRASQADEDVVMSNTSSEQPAQPPTAATCSTVTAEAPIPRLRSLVPAIFVPVSKILPSEESMRRSAALAETDRAEHMRQALARCDRHAAAVRANILTLFRRESARLMRQAVRDEERAAAVQGVAVRESHHHHHHHHHQQRRDAGGWSASSADLECMLANMAAPAPAPPPPRTSVAQILQGRSSSRRGAGDAIGDVPEPSFTHRAAATPRQLAAREALVLVSKATTELRGYNAHIAARRDMRRRALDKERAQRRTVAREVE